MPDIFETALSDIYDAFEAAGDTDICSAVFTPAVGNPVPCTVRKYRDDDMQPGFFEGQVTEEITIIEYQLADINRDIADGETFVIDSVTYTANGIVSRDSVSQRVAVI